MKAAKLARRLESPPHAARKEAGLVPWHWVRRCEIRRSSINYDLAERIVSKKYLKFSDPIMDVLESYLEHKSRVSILQNLNVAKCEGLD